MITSLQYQVEPTNPMCYNNHTAIKGDLFWMKSMI